MKRSYVIIAVLMGFIVGQNLSPGVASAQSNASEIGRIATALENISHTLSDISRNIKR